jgi:hypothetical protein
VLKILNGSARTNPGKVRDDARVVPTDKVPALPPWEVLDAKERVVFDWLCAEFLLGFVHGRPDGLLIAILAQTIVLRDLAHKKMKNPRANKSHFGEYKRHDEAVRKLMFELGFSPIGRMRHAPLMSGSVGAKTEWDSLA